MSGIEAKVALVALLGSLGIFAPLPDVIGGMMVALAGCYGTFIVSPPADRMSLWAALSVGFIVALFAAIAHPHLPLLKGLPLQLVMGLAGALSKFIAQGAVQWGKRHAQAGKLPGVPGGED